MSAIRTAITDLKDAIPYSQGIIPIQGQKTNKPKIIMQYDIDMFEYIEFTDQWYLNSTMIKVERRKPKVRYVRKVKTRVTSWKGYDNLSVVEMIRHRYSLIQVISRSLVRYQKY